MTETPHEQMMCTTFEVLEGIVKADFRNLCTGELNDQGMPELLPPSAWPTNEARAVSMITPTSDGLRIQFYDKTRAIDMLLAKLKDQYKNENQPEPEPGPPPPAPKPRHQQTNFVQAAASDLCSAANSLEMLYHISVAHPGDLNPGNLRRLITRVHELRREIEALQE